MIRTRQLLWLLFACAPALTWAADWQPRLEGNLIQGGMVVLRSPEGTRLYLNDAPLLRGPEGRTVFGFGRDAPAKAVLKWCVQDDCKSQDLMIARREYVEQRVDGVPQRTVSPPPDVLERIRAENRLVAAARRGESPRQDFATAFIWPLHGPITGVFGSRRVYNGVPKRPHFGVDVARPTGTAVVAPAAGRVMLAHDDMYFSGGTLIMDHGQGVTSTFIHLSKVLVAEGQDIRQGQLIAEVGATGRATGPHLDWRMNWGSVRLDPQLRVGPMPEWQPFDNSETGK